MRLLLLLMIAGCAVAQAPGTTYPSMKVRYDDPHTGNAAWRMTTDGAEHMIKNCLGDQSHESSSWSPDATKFCYGKKRESGCTSPKPEGVYMMDVATGVETFLAPMLNQVPQVLRAFKTLVAARRKGLPRAALEELETAGLAETWVHPDHWAAADKILSPRR